MATLRPARGPDDVAAVPSVDSLDPRLGDRARPGSLLVGLLRLARPRQWLKNLLVFAAPGAAGRLTELDVLALAGVAFVCFCLAASGTYYLNDAFDARADRLHPRKRHRPVAAGTVPVTLAKVLGAGLLAASLLLAAVAAGPQLAVVMAVYVVLMTAYSWRIKHVPVVELAVVASGFVFRAVAGGAATGVALSRWFVIVVSFASLFVVVGKRFAEYAAMGDGSAEHRQSLGEYSPAFLRYVGALSSAVAIIAYCLWAISGPATPFRLGDALADRPEHLWFNLSIAPFVLGILYYGLQAERGRAGAPEDVFLEDRTLQILGLLWVVLFTVGVYGG